MVEMTTTDPEIDVIGAILSASAIGSAANLDSKAWIRLRDYAISLFEQKAREAQPLATYADGQPQPPIIPNPPTSLTRREAKRLAQRDSWHVLGRRTRPAAN